MQLDIRANQDHSKSEKSCMEDGAVLMTLLSDQARAQPCALTDHRSLHPERHKGHDTALV